MLKNNHPACWDLVLHDLENPNSFTVETTEDFLYAEAAKLVMTFKAIQLSTENLAEIFTSLKKDIAERDKFGEQKYNTRLYPFNGRDVMKDAYEEVLDLVVYLRQAKYEADNAGNS